MGNIVYKPQKKTVLLDNCPKYDGHVTPPKIVYPEKPCETCSRCGGMAGYGPQCRYWDIYDSENRIVANMNAFANVEGMDDNNKRILKAFNEKGTTGGLAALMEGPNGENLSYAESRMLYG